MNKIFSPPFPANLTLLARIPPDLSLSQTFSYFSTFSLGEKNTWILAFNCKKKAERNSASVNLSWGRDTRSQYCVILHPQAPRLEKEGPWWNLLQLRSVPKNPLLLPASPLFGLYASLQTSFLQPLFIRGGKISLISWTIFHQSEGKRQTNQFERPDKCNKPKVYFSVPSKWVLRYCITLFI